MAIVFESAASATNSAGSSSGATNKPTGTAPGDLLILANAANAANSSDADTAFTPAGWTLANAGWVGGFARLAVFWRIADGTESSSLVVTRSAAPSAESATVALRYSGAEFRSAAVTGSSGAGTSPTPGTPSGITTGDFGVVLYATFNSSSGGWTYGATSGWDRRVNLTSSVAFGSGILAIDRVSPPSFPAVTSTYASAPWAIVSLALKPASELGGFFF